MARQRGAAENEAENEADHARLIARLFQGSRDLVSLGTQQSTGGAAELVKDDPQRAA